MQIYQSQTTKPIDRFVDDLDQAARARGFLIHNKETMAMAHTFGRHGAHVAEDFDLHMIQICKPEKACKSLSKNPERAVLMPKFVMTFSHSGATQIRFLHYRPETVRDLIDDVEFPESLAASFAEIIDVIEEAR
ncbi:MAG: DUF302 domain-containing protein [Desulfuromonadales bacterium]|jgi:hypothetical protein